MGKLPTRRFRPLSGIIYFNAIILVKDWIFENVSVPSRGLSILIEEMLVLPEDNQIVSVPSRGLSILIL